MSDGKVEIDTSINTNGIESGVKSLTAKLNSLSNNQTLGTFSKLGNAITGVKSTFDLATSAVKLAAGAVNDLSNSSKTQIKAEKQLESAAKNNPYLDEASVKALKDYASELQNIGTIGDEELLPMMAQLASTGRTQAEIQSIMSAALDVSASGMMSMDSAVQQLNATYNGNVGLLGRQVGELKDLTAEELKQGKAVDIIAQKYKGMAKDLTSATGTSEQLANTWGDFKEYIGLPFLAIKSGLESAANGFLSVINKGLGKLKTGVETIQEEVKTAQKKTASEEGYQSFLDLDSNKQNKRLEKNSLEQNQALLATGENAQASAIERINNMREDSKLKEKEILKIYGTTKEGLLDLVSYEETREKTIEAANAKIKAQVDIQQKAADAAKSQADKEAEIAKQKALRAANDEKALKMITESDNALASELEKIDTEAEMKRAIGESVDDEEIAQEKLNAMMNSYVDLLTESNGLITAENPAAKKRLEQMEKEASLISKEKLTYDDLKTSIEKYSEAALDSAKKQLEALKTQLEILLRTGDLSDKQRENVKKALEGINKKLGELKAQDISSIFGSISDGLSQIKDSYSSLSDALQDNLSDEQASDLSDLNSQYTEGLISYEDYVKGKEELDKEYAEKKYKLQMVEWALQLAQATANIAQGITADLSKGGTLGAITAATTAILGAGEIATIVANKPKKTYASGGIVGASMGADNTYAQVRNGEMILNAEQQLQLWKTANGLGNGNTPSVYLPINIENNSNSQVSASVNEHEIKITVDDIVKSSLRSGSYDTALSQQQANVNGRTIL